MRTYEWDEAKSQLNYDRHSLDFDDIGEFDWATYRARRGPQKRLTKVPVSIRLDPEVVEYFRATGEGWQSRINEALVEYITKASE